MTRSIANNGNPMQKRLVAFTILLSLCDRKPRSANSGAAAIKPGTLVRRVSIRGSCSRCLGG
jgi:hypothetical protein